MSLKEFCHLISFLSSEAGQPRYPQLVGAVASRFVGLVEALATANDVIRWRIDL